MTGIPATETKIESGPLNAANAAKHIEEVLDDLKLKDNGFTVTLAVLGATEKMPDDKPVPEGSMALCSSIVQLGGDEESRDEHLVRAFGMMGVELLNRGFPYPSLLHMVEQADKAINEGRHGSIEIADVDDLIRGAIEGLALGAEDDADLPQA